MFILLYSFEKSTRLNFLFCELFISCFLKLVKELLYKISICLISFNICSGDISLFMLILVLYSSILKILKFNKYCIIYINNYSNRSIDLDRNICNFLLYFEFLKYLLISVLMNSY